MTTIVSDEETVRGFEFAVELLALSKNAQVKRNDSGMWFINIPGKAYKLTRNDFIKLSNETCIVARAPQSDVFLPTGQCKIFMEEWNEKPAEI